MDIVDRRTILTTGALALAGAAAQSAPAEAQAGPKALFPVPATTIPIVGETDVFQVSDMTRRDLQNDMAAEKKPGELGQSFDHAAVIGPINPAAKSGISPRARSRWRSTARSSKARTCRT